MNPIQSVLITGANAGLGREAARQLALRKGIEKSIWPAAIWKKRKPQKWLYKLKPSGRSLKSFRWMSPIRPQSEQPLRACPSLWMP